MVPVPSSGRRTRPRAPGTRTDAPGTGARRTAPGGAAVHAAPPSADPCLVRAAAGFSQVLDEKLGAIPPSPELPWQTGYATPTSAFWGFRPDAVPSGATVLGGRWATAYGHPSAAPAPRAPRPPRAARSLTPSQHAALDRLRALGATDLGSDFTPGELRRAYRILARTYHPDRFQGLTPEAQARLSASFAEVAEAYRLLQAAHDLAA